ncbi:MAG: DUF4838 domain-containing protein [Clostridia bacterium]|nr:DUF4838 domain-containing protein [Clostridia bacterium]
MKLRKIISMILCVSMLLSAAAIGMTANAAEKLPFTDVPDTWYTSAVATAYAEGIMKGKTETTFDPTAKITRAEVVTAFARVAIAKTAGKGDALPFNDTVAGQWYSESVGWAAANGIVAGRGDGRFSPADNITRAELASILTKFIDYMGVKLPDNAKIDSFKDADTFDSWMTAPIEAVRKNGLMQGTDGKFNPRGNATRAEIAQVIKNLLPDVGRQTVVENGKSDYVIVIDEGNTAAVDAAERMVWQIEETCGVTVKVVDDSTSAKAKEIVLGKTSRDEKIDTSNMIRDEYEIKVDGTKIYIDAATADGLYGGAVGFLLTATSGDDVRFTVKTAEATKFEYPVGKITIAGNDISKYTVYYPADADEACITAANDISYYIEEACGVKLPVKAGTAKDYGIIIKYISSDKEFDDSFSFKSEGTSIVISGHRDRGAEFGAYDFLEEYIGVRFLGDADAPHKDFFYIAEADSIDLSNIDDTETPYFTYRTLAGTPNPSTKYQRDLSWATSNCHMFGYLLADDPFADDSYLPDVYPCLTSEADRTKIINNMDRYIQRHIDTYGEVPDIVDFAYTDNSYYCHCDACEEINNKYQSPASTLVLFLNDVAEYYSVKYPDMKIHTLAYWHTLTPPVGLKAHPNVVVQYCTISNCYNHGLDYNCYYNQQSRDEISGWAQVADELHVWDYCFNWAYNATPYPILSYDNVMEKYQFLYENNVDLIFQNGGGWRMGNFQQLNMYANLLATWDPYMSEDEYYRYLQDACRGFYGDGWKQVYDTVMLLEEKYDRCLVSEQTPYEAMMHMYMRSYIDQCLSNMEAARLLAKTEYQWANIDNAMMQFQHVKLDTVFDSMNKSSDPAVREELQDMCRDLYSKYLTYNLGLSGTVPNPAMPDFFGASPSNWRKWAYNCADTNGDGVRDDPAYDANGNWLTENQGWW